VEERRERVARESECVSAQENVNEREANARQTDINRHRQRQRYIGRQRGRLTDRLRVR
jgi:hypothetical protein